MNDMGNQSNYSSATIQRPTILPLDRFGFIQLQSAIWDRRFVQKCPIDEPAVRNYFSPIYSR